MVGRRVSGQTSEDDRDESQSERADRNYVEMVQEVRVAQGGVQILFGFLLALGFTAAFPVGKEHFVWVLTAALLCSGGAALSFLAPVVFHRGHFREGRKEALVWVTHWFAIMGLVLLIGSMLLSVWLVLAFLWSEVTASIIAGGLALSIFGAWVAVEVYLRRAATKHG
jgi:Family of unknown function (DUF6328)